MKPLQLRLSFKIAMFNMALHTLSWTLWTPRMHALAALPGLAGLSLHPVATEQSPTDRGCACAHTEGAGMCGTTATAHAQQCRRGHRPRQQIGRMARHSAARCAVRLQMANPRAAACAQNVWKTAGSQRTSRAHGPACWDALAPLQGGHQENAACLQVVWTPGPCAAPRRLHPEHQSKIVRTRQCAHICAPAMFGKALACPAHAPTPHRLKTLQLGPICVSAGLPAFQTPRSS